MKGANWLLSQKTGAPGCLLYSCENPWDGHRLFHSGTAYMWNAISAGGDESSARQIKVKAGKYMHPFPFSSSSENKYSDNNVKDLWPETWGTAAYSQQKWQLPLKPAKCAGSLEICHEIRWTGYYYHTVVVQIFWNKEVGGFMFNNEGKNRQNL